MFASTDQKLVAGILEGNEKAFTLFFRDYFPRLFNFARTRLWDNEDFAEEAAQNTLSKAIQNMESFRGEASLFTWLCTFCRHEIGYIIKREQKMGNNISLIDDNDQVIAALSSLNHVTAQDPLLHYQKHELASLVHLAKTHIPSTYSDILEWKYLNGYSVKEIARKLDRNPKAAESLLTRARQAFKEAFLVLIDADKADFWGNQHD